ncbi:MAG TPA: NYN domain-containing protein, partial [Burkholderiales bacterium]|nr:NYN domain-containing protein [Burkholderiales bacterium]
APLSSLAPESRVAPAPVPPDPRRILRSGERVALFVDGANMDHACREAGYFVDYRKAREFLVGDAVCYAAYYYLADFTATDPLQQRFLDFLSHSGYIVRRKPVKVIRDEETGERIIKANVDTEIVLDMLNTVGNYDVAFLLSGDGDFERAVELLRSRGKRVYVVTSRRSLSRELAYVADKPIFLLEELRAAIGREDRVPVPRAAER